MKIHQVLLTILIMIGLCGCGAIRKPEPVQQEGEALQILSFSFTHSGSSMEECFRYSATQEDGGTRLYAEELFSGGLIVDTIIDDPVLDQLGEIAGKYRLDQWDGFDKNNKHVMDGSSFSLSITLADGTSISARGSNRFPDGYSDAEREIRAVFEELIQQ